MKRTINEQAVIFVSVVKWALLATVVGIVAGAATAFFVKALNWGFGLSQVKYYFLLIPLGLAASALIGRYLMPEGHGADKAIETIHKARAGIRAKAVPVEFITTFLTITSGGSAGKEGPAAQIGAGLASLVADAFRLKGADRAKLAICGISAGFASVFGTPIAGAIFGIEVMFAGRMLYDVMLPSFIAGIISYQVSAYLGLAYFYNPITIVPVFSELFFLKVAISGVFFGFCSIIFIEILKFSKMLGDKTGLPASQKAVLGGACLIALTFIFNDKYLGLGIETIERALNGGGVEWYAFLLKPLFTGITLGFGGSGGIGTPVFFVGSTAGSALSGVLGVDAAMLSAIGFVALLAGAANTPIAASIMAIELFGPGVAPYAAVASVISFIISGHRSAYASQIVFVKKSASIEVELGSEIGKAKPIYQTREGSWLYFLNRLRQRIFGGEK